MIKKNTLNNVQISKQFINYKIRVGQFTFRGIPSKYMSIQFNLRGLASAYDKFTKRRFF